MTIASLAAKCRVRRAFRRTIRFRIGNTAGCGAFEMRTHPTSLRSFSYRYRTCASSAASFGDSTLGGVARSDSGRARRGGLVTPTPLKSPLSKGRAFSSNVGPLECPLTAER